MTGRIAERHPDNITKAITRSSRTDLVETQHVSPGEHQEQTKSEPLEWSQPQPPDGCQEEQQAYNTDRNLLQVPCAGGSYDVEYDDPL